MNITKMLTLNQRLPTLSFTIVCSVVIAVVESFKPVTLMFKGCIEFKFPKFV